MQSRLCTLLLATGACATRPFLNEPDTGFEEATSLEKGVLPPLDAIKGLPDFEAAARNYMDIAGYTYYRAGAGGEWSYRNNLEVFQRYTFRPRVMRDIIDVEDTMPTSILGYNFSAPFFIAPAARGDLGNHDDRELGLLHAAYDEDVLWVPSLLASMSVEEIADEKPSDGSQILFQQLYLSDPRNDTEFLYYAKRFEKAGAKAIVLTVDSAGDGNRQRAARYGVGSADIGFTYLTWEVYDHLRTLTSLPIVLKGIQTVEDAKTAVEHGADAIFLSNHGGRQTDGSPSSLEVALEIYNSAPEVFTQTEVLADGGVRYGSDVIKLLALGVKAVGLARPFMYANCYGYDGVKKGIQLLKTEIINDAANLGISDLQAVDADIVNWELNHWL
jgi:isopentenyl diphosphate isomerase/L-lactate dehydrogenase-like FMN-dependent dehydrogenase